MNRTEELQSTIDAQNIIISKLKNANERQGREIAHLKRKMKEAVSHIYAIKGLLRN